jgi:quercetin dioxygenase-like cupin family protein
MKRTKQEPRKSAIHSWKHAQSALERWRRNLATLHFELKQPRVIHVLPIDFIGGEPAEREGKPTRRFWGQLIYFTKDDATIRRPSGAIFVVDSYEVASLSDRKTRLEFG